MGGCGDTKSFGGIHRLLRREAATPMREKYMVSMQCF